MKLECYAPGDGALAFGYSEERWNNKTGHRETISVSEPVTREAIEKYLTGESEKYQSYLIVEFPGGPNPIYRLVAPVVRVGENTLRLGDTVYSYSAIDPTNTFLVRDGEYVDHNLRITFHHRIESAGEVLVDEPEHEVKNISTRGALRFFLNNENVIVAQYPEQDTRLKEVSRSVEITLTEEFINATAHTPRQTFAAIGYLATWAMLQTERNRYSGPVTIYGANDGNLHATYRNPQNETTYVLFGLRGDKGEYSFHS